MDESPTTSASGEAADVPGPPGVPDTSTPRSPMDDGSGQDSQIPMDQQDLAEDPGRTVSAGSLESSHPGAEGNAANADYPPFSNVPAAESTVSAGSPRSTVAAGGTVSADLPPAAPPQTTSDAPRLLAETVWVMVVGADGQNAWVEARRDRNNPENLVINMPGGFVLHDPLSTTETCPDTYYGYSPADVSMPEEPGGEGQEAALTELEAAVLSIQGEPDASSEPADPASEMFGAASDVLDYEVEESTSDDEMEVIVQEDGSIIKQPDYSLALDQGVPVEDHVWDPFVGALRPRSPSPERDSLEEEIDYTGDNYEAEPPPSGSTLPGLEECPSKGPRSQPSSSGSESGRQTPRIKSTIHVPHQTKLAEERRRRDIEARFGTEPRPSSAGSRKSSSVPPSDEEADTDDEAEDDQTRHAKRCRSGRLANRGAPTHIIELPSVPRFYYPKEATAGGPYP